MGTMPTRDYYLTAQRRVSASVSLCVNALVHVSACTQGTSYNILCDCFSGISFYDSFVISKHGRQF